MGEHRKGAKGRVEELRERGEEARARAGEITARAQEARGRIPVLDVVFRAGERDREAGGGVLAGALAFRVFLFFVPYVFVLVTVMGLFRWAGIDPSGVFPDQGIGRYLVESITVSSGQSWLGWVLSLVVGVVVLAWTAWSFLRAMNEASRFAWRLPYRPLPHPTQAFIGLLIWILGMTFVPSLLSFLHQRLGIVGDVLVLALGWLAYTILWFVLLSRFSRREGVPAIALLPGAAAFGFALQILSVATAIWMGFRIESATDKYGDLGTAVALLAWLAIFGRMAVGSCVVNASLWERSHPRAEPPAPGEAAGSGDPSPPS